MFDTALHVYFIVFNYVYVFTYVVIYRNIILPEFLFSLFSLLKWYFIFFDSYLVLSFPWT